MRKLGQVVVRVLSAVIVALAMSLPSFAQAPPPSAPDAQPAQPERNPPAPQYALAAVAAIIVLCVVCMPSRKG